MKKYDFLKMLSDEGRLRVVPPSAEVSKSYLEKSANSLRAAQLLIEAGLLEESVSMSYYSMYHCLTALLRGCGIKCENHTGSMIILKEVLGNDKLYEIISNAKRERIDKQYFIDFAVAEADALDLVESARYFTSRLRLMIDNLKTAEIQDINAKMKEVLARE